MPGLPKKLRVKLEKRKEDFALRKLSISKGIDFSSNDYLGFSRCSEICIQAIKLLESEKNTHNGATGSRLLTGNYPLLEELESTIANFHRAEAALVFNSGFDANLGFFSCVPQRNDIILYDELCHASIRDGIQLSQAKSFKFEHNDLNDLDNQINRFKNKSLHTEIYVVTESIFSMDGDTPDLVTLSKICQENQCRLIVDEAHACGIFGKGKGLMVELNLDPNVFARLITFGKAFGSHGAAWLGSNDLKTYLINYARSFIYTTAMPPHNCATVLAAYQYLQSTDGKKCITTLMTNIEYFNSCAAQLGLKSYFGLSNSAIQIFRVNGNVKAKTLALNLQKAGIDVRAILSPTVPKGKERLRFCLHAYNSKVEIKSVLQLLKENV